jgi:hypothetical protein
MQVPRELFGDTEADGAPAETRKGEIPGCCVTHVTFGVANKRENILQVAAWRYGPAEFLAAT